MQHPDVGLVEGGAGGASLKGHVVRAVLATSKSAFETIHDGDNSLFYTGHVLAPGLSIKTRKRLARGLGAACHVFVVKTVTLCE
jgi:hypothetical protein